MEISDLTFQLDKDSGGIVLHAPSEKEVHLHPIWLRERVADPANLDIQTQQRLYEPTDIVDDIRVTSAQIKNSDILELSFSDGLHSYVSLPKVLRELKWQKDYEAMPEPVIWTSGYQDWPKASWPSLKDPKYLKAMLENYYKYGFCLLSDTPTKRDSLLTLARTFGTIRETNFGVLFDVETKLEPTDLADTNLALPAHTDNPYRLPIPGVQFLHCLHNDVNGGFGTLVDGLAIVAELERMEPEMAKTLSTTQVRFRYDSMATILQSNGSLLEYDHDGTVKCVRLSSRVDYVPPLDTDTLSKFYTARKLMHKMANEPKYQFKFTYEPGLLLMMNNTRLLHGRTAYNNEQGHRLLQGCYIDHDGPDSLYRKLVRDLKVLPINDKDR